MPTFSSPRGRRATLGAALAAVAMALPATGTSQCATPACAAGSVGAFNSSRLGLECSPTGNPPMTMTTLSVQGETSAANTREFLVNLGLVSSSGSKSDPTPYHDKVTLYTGMVAVNGTGDVWSINPLLTMSPGSGSYNAQGIELDFNNDNAHRGDADAGFGLGAPVAYGFSVTGAGGYRSTAGIGVMGEKQMWNRGIVFANDCVAQSTFQDLGNPQKSVDIRGNPGFGVYQSSAQSKNYFAGKTGLGTAAAPDAALHVGGDAVVEGRLVKRVARRGSGGSGGHVVEHAAMHRFASRASEATHRGAVTLDARGGAEVRLPSGWAAATEPGTATISLTAVGEAMPGLFAVEGEGGRERFGVRGGSPRGRVHFFVAAVFAGEG